MSMFERERKSICVGIRERMSMFESDRKSMCERER